MQYKPVHADIEAGMFLVQWEMIDIHASTEKVIYRLIFNDTTLELIQVKDALTYKLLGTYEHITIWPATQFLQSTTDLKTTLKRIENEMLERVAWFDKQWLYAEAQRLKKRVSYDIKMIQETWFVNGIENYSPYFEDRLDGAPPNTLFDYFPEDFLLIVDESHMTLPQFWGMPRADTSRKQSLVDHGFRLPSAIHHRPLAFDELSVKMWWKSWEQVDVHESLKEVEQDVKTLYVSATPAKYELEQCRRIVQQVIRPTWLLDPITYVYPKSGNYDHLLASADTLLKKHPELTSYVTSYEDQIHTDLF